LIEQAMDPEEAQLHTAITQLLGAQAVHCRSDDVIVKKANTLSGNTMYVVIALQGAENSGGEPNCAILAA